MSKKNKKACLLMQIVLFPFTQIFENLSNSAKLPPPSLGVGVILKNIHPCKILLGFYYFELFSDTKCKDGKLGSFFRTTNLAEHCRSHLAEYDEEDLAKIGKFLNLFSTLIIYYD